MDYAFIRHNIFDSAREDELRREIIPSLFNRRLVALRYDDIESVDPKDYLTHEGKPWRSAQAAIGRLRSYCNEGVVIGAAYGTDIMLVGRINPGTEIRPEEFRPGVILKTAQLVDVREVRYVHHPILMIQPPYGALSLWAAGKGVLEAVMHGRSVAREPGNLHPGQHEVLCYEWLRSAAKLERLLMPLGRGLPDIDILGVNADGRKVIAQVTYQRQPRELARKQEVLMRHWEEGMKAFFFLPRGARLEKFSQVRQVELETVLEDLSSADDDATRAMLKAMFP
ncbi:hypothetical protein ASD77_08190 [Pseudoxanthomonas sp. Root65]|uniref:hypothetical protein n=1 Tax=Pseudoxanthomonas sp. Root65 TaxID=1736576 RepID=UPI0006F59185|nr:hypothetical protein [Pseudoxanthomonas sp. Root65]KRA54559.1 hypothetical protein ASD77_08190 [Pseudoxanthomonas sp. Root65]